MSDTLEEQRREHDLKLARIASRQDAFSKSPVWFTVWDWGVKIINAVFWVGVWFLFAQCSCSGCITGAVK